MSARGFWQVHPGAAATFVDAALELLVPQPGETVLDLYSGVGVFTAALAEAVGPTGRVLAVESDAEATVHAKANCAAYQGVAVVRAGRRLPRCGPPQAQGARRPAAAQAACPASPRPTARRPHPARPAANGRGPTGRHPLTALGPKAIVYVACDPAALARDTAYLGSVVTTW